MGAEISFLSQMFKSDIADRSGDVEVGLGEDVSEREGQTLAALIRGGELPRRSYNETKRHTPGAEAPLSCRAREEAQG
jgi:hypothetical protein